MIPPGPFRRCLRVVFWIPVLIITSVVFWSYYAYVVQLCFMAYLLMFHMCFGMFLWTYWKSIFTPPASPSKEFRLSCSDRQWYEMQENPQVQQQILVEISQRLPIYCCSASGAIRFCNRCQVIKPDRSHHCSACETLNNCVGFSNYKFFLLFLAYSIIYCFFIAATVLRYFIKYWVGELPNRPAKLHVLFLMLVALMFFVTLSVLFGYHCWLVARNRSTLESLSAPFFPHGPDRNSFNVGIRENFLQVFGEEKILWLLPMFSSQGNGHSFPTRSQSKVQDPLLAKEAGSDVESLGPQRSLPHISRNRDIPW